MNRWTGGTHFPRHTRSGHSALTPERGAFDSENFSTQFPDRFPLTCHRATAEVFSLLSSGWYDSFAPVLVLHLFWYKRQSHQNIHSISQQDAGFDAMRCDGVNTPQLNDKLRRRRDDNPLANDLSRVRSSHKRGSGCVRLPLSLCCFLIGIRLVAFFYRRKEVNTLFT